MAHTLSAQKRVRQSAKHRRRNKAVKSLVKNAVQVATPEGGKPADVAAVRKACQLIDKAVAKGVLHKNTAARRKSALTRPLAAKPAGK